MCVCVCCRVEIYRPEKEKNWDDNKKDELLLSKWTYIFAVVFIGILFNKTTQHNSNSTWTQINHGIRLIQIDIVRIRFIDDVCCRRLCAWVCFIACDYVPLCIFVYNRKQMLDRTNISRASEFHRSIKHCLVRGIRKNSLEPNTRSISTYPETCWTV